MRDSQKREKRAAVRAAATAVLEGLERRALLTVAPAGPEFLVNAYTPDDQIYPSVAADADGDFVVAWESEGQDGSGYGVYFQRYNDAGQPLAGPIRAANTTFGNQYSTSVGMDDAGNVVIAWTSEFQDGSGYGIFARRFDTSGNPLGNEFQVNTFTDNNQTDPSVAVDPDGDFVVAWQSYGNDGNTWGVAARRYDATVAAQGAEFQVNQTTAGVQAFPSVAAADNGNFVITWHDNSAAGDYNIYARAYGATGAPLTNEGRINTFVAGNQSYPDVDVDAAGNAIFTWRSDGQDGDGAGVVVQRFTAAGAPAGTEILANTTTAGDQSFPSIAVADDGTFIVTWYSDNKDGSGTAIVARDFNAAGVPQGPEVQINTFTPDDQQFPSIAVDGDGDYVIAWDSENRDGDGFGIAARQIATGPADTTAPTADIVDVTPDPRNTPVDSITIVFSEPVTGFDISDLQFFRGATVVPLTGATLTTTDGQTFVLGNLFPLTQDAGDYVLFLNSETSGITDQSGNPLAADAQDGFRIDSLVVGRSIFYNDSAFDNSNPAAEPADDGAIAPDKQALLPGQRATYANYSNYTNGVNGIMIDVRGLPASALTAENFRFRIGNSSDPNDFTPAPAPTQILVREGAGVNGSDRVEIVFANGAIKNTYLEVSFLSTDDTGLAEADVFYFGNLQGEIGDNPNAAVVNALDLAGTKQNQNTTATITSPYDHNHDGRVNALDLAAVKQNQNNSINLIQPPADSTVPPAAATSLVTGSVTGSATKELFSSVAV